MAKKIVHIRRRRSLKISGVLGVLTFITVLVFMFTSIVTKSSNSDLARELQDTQNNIKIVRDETEAITASIQALRNYNRVVGIANEAGLDLHHESIITVTPGE